MEQHADYLIRNATVVDGTGAPGFGADVAVQGDRIVGIGDLSQWTARNVIEGRGRVLAPGFIDTHTHDDRLMLSDSAMLPKVSQGITTVVAGNCGISLAPTPQPMPMPITPPLDLLDNEGRWFAYPTFASYVAQLRETAPSTNSALLVGHTTLRVGVMSALDRPATSDEIERMKALLEEAMQAGAIGLSTGLAYAPAIASSTPEIIALARVAACYGGIYSTHLRDESDQVIEALEEAFLIGREAGLPVVISHHKVAGLNNFGRSEETLALIRKRMAEQEIYLDCYPYAASSTVLVADKAANSAKVTITWSRPEPEMGGRDLDDIVQEWGCGIPEAVARLQPAGAIYHRMDEADVSRILAFEETMIGSDGLPHDAVPHPRLWGSFPRVLGHYARDLGLFSFETAIHKMTGLSAGRYGLRDRGVIREGAFADLVLLDADTVADAASFSQPAVASTGIDWVMVNGQLVWDKGRPTRKRPGLVLRREPQADNQFVGSGK